MQNAICKIYFFSFLMSPNTARTFVSDRLIHKSFWKSTFHLQLYI